MPQSMQCHYKATVLAKAHTSLKLTVLLCLLERNAALLLHITARFVEWNTENYNKYTRTVFNDTHGQ